MSVSTGVVLATLFDIPLIFTLCAALLCRNIAIVLLVIAAFVISVYLFLGTSLSAFDESLFIMMIPQLFVGLYLHRAKAFLLRRPLITKIYSVPFLYRKLSVPLLEWNWTERSMSLINRLARWLDVVTLPLFFLVSLLIMSDGEEWLAMMAVYVGLWAIFLVFGALPLAVVESAGRFISALSKTDRPKEMTDAAKDELIKLRDNLAERDIPNRAKSWLKDGFSAPKD